MNPLDFISLAIRLSNSEKEVDLRSAVSRAYHGAFHFARLTLVECGIRFPPNEIHGAEIHTKVRYCFNAAGHQQCGASLDFIQVRERLLAYARDVLRLPVETKEAGP